MQQLTTKDLDVMLLCAVGKLYSDQSTRLLNELANTKQKHHFKQAVKYIDKLNTIIENGVNKTPAAAKTYDLLVEELNTGLNNLRTDLLNAE